MLLAYYVSAVNIETTYNALRAEEAKRNDEPEPEYVPFSNIALADTFQIHEDGDIPDLHVFRENNETIERQRKAPINVVIGNPPYSAGQKSANDLNANLKYPTLDKRSREPTRQNPPQPTKIRSTTPTYAPSDRYRPHREPGCGRLRFQRWLDRWQHR